MCRGLGERAVASGLDAQKSATGGVGCGHGNNRRVSALRPCTLIRFVEAIQEHERIDVPDLKSGIEIGSDYGRRWSERHPKKVAAFEWQEWRL
jgi:hypothetical protein